ncbi:MAG: CBS domain-containing protein [Eubacteriales bacterium]
MRVLVRDVMSKGVLKLKRGQTIKEVNQLFIDRVIDGAPVVDDEGKVIGVFTKTHLMRAMGKSLDTPIERLMNKNVISIGETMPVEEAMNIPVGRLPVVNREGKMVGWLTRTDLASAFIDHYQNSIEGLWQVINSTAHGIIAIDNDAKIKVFNKTGERLWGVEAQMIMGMAVDEVFPVMQMEDILRTGEPVRCKLQVDGVLFNIDMTPIKAAGQINGAVAEFRPAEE